MTLTESMSWLIGVANILCAVYLLIIFAIELQIRKNTK